MKCPIEQFCNDIHVIVVNILLLCYCTCLKFDEQMCTRYLSYILPLDIDCGNGNGNGRNSKGMGITLENWEEWELCAKFRMGIGTRMSPWK